ncbi:hypothetical protein FSJ12_012580, partial [Escherichia coli]|nr:hypothetical protein [Escherichia coli]
WSTSKTPSYTKSVSWQHHHLSPLVHSDRDAELLAREMILAHEKWLPNFADCIAELKKAH